MKSWPKSIKRIRKASRHRLQVRSQTMTAPTKSRAKVLTVELPEELSGLFHRHYDKILVDDSLSDLDVVLLSVYLNERSNNKAGVSYADCKYTFTFLGRKEVNFKANIYLAKKNSLVELADSAIFLTIHGLKRIRAILGQVEKSPVHVIKSGQNFTAVKLLEEFLVNEIDSEEISLCDAYLSSTTLFPFSTLSGRVRSIRILTSNVYDSDKFREYKAKFEKENGIAVEVKVSSKIHDRYLISGDKCWSFGASIKDLGNKDTTIREISEVTSSIRDLFEERWKESSSFS